MTRNKNLMVPGPVPYEKIEDLHQRIAFIEHQLHQLKADVAENTQLTKSLKGDTHE